jgi:hypothetical protein
LIKSARAPTFVYEYVRSLLAHAHTSHCMTIPRLTLARRHPITLLRAG